MKTAVTVLQEMMIKGGLMPEYECVSQTGPQHQSLFEYRCEAYGKVATAAARSKKEAKQEVARVMLQILSASGHPVPAPFGIVAATSALHDDSLTTGSPADTRSYVALLKELCQEYRLTPVEYELVGDTGPPHLRHFTVKARIGQHERLATSTTKKAARQLAAEKLYTYLRENLARVTKDFDEDEALARAHDKAMDRYQESIEEYHRRPDLSQRIADYHKGLVTQLEPGTHARVSAMLEQLRPRETQSPERVMSAVVEAMRLDVTFSELPRTGEEPLTVLELAGCSPELAFPGDSRASASKAALDYLRLTFNNSPEHRDQPSGFNPWGSILAI